MKDASVIIAVLLFSSTNAAPIDKREGISSCGTQWMAVNDVSTNNGEIRRRGFNTAVDFFCDKAGGQTLGPNLYFSMVNRVWLSYGGVPETTGTNGYVYFEIHNKRNTNHVVDAAKCKEYLKKLGATGSTCYGSDHKDTKGGTFQVGNNDVSYHALPNAVPSTFDALDKSVVSTGEIKPLGNGGKGRTLDPFPTYVFNDITPVPCHSHNDYEQDTALYSALSAGCTSVEADIWPHGDKLTVGHTDPGSNGPTIQDLYLNPIKKLLDERGAIFPSKPSQSLSLLIDFKGNGEETWDLLVNALQPLRDAGYLSRYDGGFKEGKITVVGSGNAIIDGTIPAPIAKASSANPNGSLFMDARIHKDMSKFEASNAYFASAKFSDAVQGGGGPITGGSLDKMRKQIQAAHTKGFKVRYWDIPSEAQWQQLLDEGVDRLNVDDLEDVAALNFII